MFCRIGDMFLERYLVRERHKNEGSYRITVSGEEGKTEIKKGLRNKGKELEN
jgi:hypothetical protein